MQLSSGICACNVAKCGWRDGITALYLALACTFGDLEEVLVAISGHSAIPLRVNSEEKSLCRLRVSLHLIGLCMQV